MQRATKSGAMSAVEEHAATLAGAYPPDGATVTVLRDGACETAAAQYTRERAHAVLEFAYAKAPNGAWLALGVGDTDARADASADASVAKFVAVTAAGCERMHRELLLVASTLVARRRAVRAIRGVVRGNAAKARMATLVLLAHNPPLRKCVSTEDAVRVQCAMLFRAQREQGAATPSSSSSPTFSLARIVEDATQEVSAAVTATREPYTYLFECVCSVQLCVVVAILLFGDQGKGIFYIVSNWECMLGCLYSALQHTIKMHVHAKALLVVARVLERAIPTWMMELIVPTGPAKELVAGIVARLWEYVPMHTGGAGACGHDTGAGGVAAVGVDAAARAAFRLDERSTYNEPCEAVSWMLGLTRHYATIVELNRLTSTLCAPDEALDEKDEKRMRAAVGNEEALKSLQARMLAVAPAAVRRLEAWCPALVTRIFRYGVYGACLARASAAGPAGPAGPAGAAPTWSRRSLLDFILRTESPVMYAALTQCAGSAVEYVAPSALAAAPTAFGSARPRRK